MSAQAFADAVGNTNTGSSCAIGAKKSVDALAARHAALLAARVVVPSPQSCSAITAQQKMRRTRIVMRELKQKS